MMLNRKQAALETISLKNQNGYLKTWSATGHIWTIRKIIEGVRNRNLTAVLLFIDFSKALFVNYIHRAKL